MRIVSRDAVRWTIATVFDKDVGTIEPGKIANLIVTTGDPLELITDVRYLFIKGQPTSLENKHHRLYEEYLHRPKPSVQRRSFSFSRTQETFPRAPAF